MKDSFWRWTRRLAVGGGLLILGTWVEISLDVAEKIVLAENLWFHEEILEVRAADWGLVDEERGIYRLRIDSRVRFTAKPAYALRVTFPETFGLMNRGEFASVSGREQAAANELHLAIDRRHYRDLERSFVLFLYPRYADGKGRVTVELLDGDGLKASRTVMRLEVRDGRVSAFAPATVVEP